MVQNLPRFCTFFCTTANLIFNLRGLPLYSHIEASFYFQNRQADFQLNLPCRVRLASLALIVPKVCVFSLIGYVQPLHSSLIQESAYLPLIILQTVSEARSRFSAPFFKAVSVSVTSIRIPTMARKPCS